MINTDHIFAVASGTHNTTVIRFVGGVSINVRETYEQMKKCLNTNKRASNFVTVADDVLARDTSSECPHFSQTRGGLIDKRLI